MQDASAGLWEYLQLSIKCTLMISQRSHCEQAADISDSIISYTVRKVATIAYV